MDTEHEAGEQGQCGNAGWRAALRCRLVRVVSLMILIVFADNATFAESTDQIEGHGVSTSAAAQVEPKQFSIAPQSLDAALAAFSAVTRIQVLTSGEVTQGLTSPGVSGSMIPEEALRHLLAGTSLTYRFLNADTVTLERVL